MIIKIILFIILVLIVSLFTRKIPQPKKMYIFTTCGFVFGFLLAIVESMLN